ncbi:MAG TPA: T9SS type A sorting domain-containing protein, partial [bacterium]|nr:T9SS type A sorting domain-containing protein [bacterium]
ATSTQTETHTATPTASATDSPTATPSLTPSLTATSTLTSTLTASPTLTDSPTPSLTSTLTPLNILTATPSSTPTGLSTFTPSSTPSPTPGYSISLPYPNPSNGSFIHWDIQTSEPLVIQWAVYTTNNTKIFQQTLNVANNQTLTWNLEDRWGHPVANGIYFVRFQVRASSGNSTFIFKVIVLN